MALPKSPVVPGLEDREIVIAENQDEFLALPALVKRGENNQITIISRWELSEEDRARIAAGADVFVEVMLLENLLTPYSVRVLDVGNDRGTLEEEGY